MSYSNVIHLKFGRGEINFFFNYGQDFNQKQLHMICHSLYSTSAIPFPVVVTSKNSVFSNPMRNGEQVSNILAMAKFDRAKCECFSGHLKCDINNLPEKIMLQIENIDGEKVETFNGFALIEVAIK